MVRRLTTAIGVALVVMGLLGGWALWPLTTTSPAAIEAGSHDTLFGRIYHGHRPGDAVRVFGSVGRVLYFAPGDATIVRFSGTTFFFRVAGNVGAGLQPGHWIVATVVLRSAVAVRHNITVATEWWEALPSGIFNATDLILIFQAMLPPGLALLLIGLGTRGRRRGLTPGGPG